MNRRPLSIRGVLWLTVSALTVMIALLVVQAVYVQWQQLQKIQSLQEAIQFTDKLFMATEKLSVERDVAFTMLHARNAEDIKDLQSRLKDSRRETDAAFADAMISMKQYNFPELGELRKTVETHLNGIRALRDAVDKNVALPPDQRQSQLIQHWYDEVTGLIVEAQDLWLRFIKHFTDIDPIVTQHLRYKHFLLIIDDYSGRERALIGKLLVENADPTPEEVGNLLRWQGVLELSWKTARQLANQSGLYAQVGPYFKDAESHYQNMHDMVRNLFYIPGSKHGVSYPVSANLWLELSAQASESFDALKNASRKAKHDYLIQLEQSGEKSIALHLAILVLGLGLCVFCFRIVNVRVLRPINGMITALVDATQGKASTYVLPANQQDEIGKLAEVLHVFQQNAEAIRQNAITLQNYTYALERSNKELDDFAYIASHDLKEPLRGIHNHSRFLLEDNQDKLDQDSIQRLGRLAYLSQRMERLVNDLLYFSRLGRQDLAIQNTDINAVIHDIESTLDVFLSERHAKIIMPRPLPWVTCDRPRITEVFRNLITNAIKYNDKPEKIVEIGFHSEQMAPEGDRAANVFYVRDNGKGIDKEFYTEIFRIFKRLESQKNLAEEGTGVGLTFVKKIVERHGGKIWLESEIGKGTVFYFTLGGQTYDTQTA